MWRADAPGQRFDEANDEQRQRFIARRVRLVATARLVRAFAETGKPVSLPPSLWEPDLLVASVTRVVSSTKAGGWRGGRLPHDQLNR
jgi:hypothetical protein